MPKMPRGLSAVVLVMGCLGGCSASTGASESKDSASAAFPFTVAQRVAGSAGYVSKHRAGLVVVGERWGCAEIATEGKATWQCWEAHAPGANDSKALRAFAVPWLDNKRGVFAAADHICAFETPELALRCWKRPLPGQAAGRAFAERGEWLNPHHAPFEDSMRPDWPGAVFVGGTFACLRNEKGDAWCVGDNRFGQLGSAAGRKPGAAPNVPPFLGVWPAHGVALGTWHGCAIAAPNGLLADVYASCWGRGDLGQLGGDAAPDVCTVEGGQVGCARSPVKNVTLGGGMAALGAGDQFTCVTEPDGIRCWGASRDGFFGEPGSCPKAVEQAWPTLNGPVSAPNARCSKTPAPVPAAHGFVPEFQVGPRGLCFVEGSKLRCLGAIPTPRLDGVRYAKVSAGQDASACTQQGGSVLCWGEGYSQPNALDVPVTIELEAVPAVGEVAVTGAVDPSGWGASCLVRTKCTISPAPIAPCGPEVHARDWAEILASASMSEGHRVQVRGRLGVGPMKTTMVECGRACCEGRHASVVLAGAPQTLALDGFFCAGDESQTCCNAPAYGQPIVAIGELARPSRVQGTDWQLAHAVLCSEGGGASHTIGF